MNEAQILARRKEVEDFWNELKAKKEKLNEELIEVNTELVKLEGEYRAFSRLLDGMQAESLRSTGKKTKVSPEANVIDADAAIEEK